MTTISGNRVQAPATQAPPTPPPVQTESAPDTSAPETVQNESMQQLAQQSGGSRARRRPPRQAQCTPRAAQLDVGTESRQRLEGTQVSLEVERFIAPRSNVGGGFAGDDRGFTEDPAATSRVRTAVRFETSNGQVTPMDADASSSPSHIDVNGTRPANPRTATPSMTARMETPHCQGQSSATVRVEAHGENPFTAPLVATARDAGLDIEMNADIEATERVSQDEEGNLRIDLAVDGDNWPSGQSTLRNAHGQAVIVGTFTAPSSDLGPARLSGPADTPHQDASVTVLRDDSGRFTGVQDETGRTWSVSDWNTRMRARPAEDDSHGVVDDVVAGAGEAVAEGAEAAGAAISDAAETVRNLVREGVRAVTD